MVCELWSVWTLSNISPTETFRQSSESLCQESFLSFFFLLSSCQRNLHLNQEAQRCTETSTTRSELQSLFFFFFFRLGCSQSVALDPVTVLVQNIWAVVP